MKKEQQLFATQSGANFSECRKYRYALWRIWDDTKPFIMFIGLNPSTANEDKDDPTIRRIKSMAKNLGYGGVYMLNCFPYISTNPDDLRDFGNTAINDIHLLETSFLCNEVVFAWGSFNIVKELGRDKELSAIFPKAKALIINKDGSPRHPLYVPNKTQLVNFKLLKNDA